MVYSVGIIALTVLVLVLIKYLQYKFRMIFFKAFVIIISLNILFFGYFEISGIINDIRITNKFDKNIQLYDKGHPDYGLLKNYESLTEEEKRIYDAHIGDGGRNLFLLMINPALCLINASLIFTVYFVSDGIIHIIKILKRKV